MGIDSLLSRLRAEAVTSATSDLTAHVAREGWKTEDVTAVTSVTPKMDSEEAQEIKRHDATNPHLRVITRSVTRPEAFEHLSPEWRETWQAIVYGVMADGGWQRTEAEREAWRLVRQ